MERLAHRRRDREVLTAASPDDLEDAIEAEERHGR
jgi:hypothetical protein